MLFFLDSDIIITRKTGVAIIYSACRRGRRCWCSWRFFFFFFLFLAVVVVVAVVDAAVELAVQSLTAF